MNIPWDDLRLFLQVADSGSLSAAARSLGMGQPALTRRLQALEHTLGAKLFLRSAAGAKLTKVGERLLAPARRMGESAGEVSRVMAKGETLRGLVRITSTPLISFDFLAPFAASVSQRYPGLALEVLSTMNYLDLKRGEAELAIRLQPPEHGLQLVAEAQFEGGAFVSPELHARLPKRPKLSEIPWIAWAPPFEHLPPNPMLNAVVPGFVPAFTSDNILVNLAAAQAGVGAMVLGKVRHRFQRQTGLLPLDVDLGPQARTRLYLMCARSSLDVARVRAVAQMLSDELTAMSV